MDFGTLFPVLQKLFRRILGVLLPLPQPRPRNNTLGLPVLTSDVYRCRSLSDVPQGIRWL